MDEACTCRDLENGIHELVMIEASRQAVEQYYAHVEQIACSAQERDAANALFLLDVSQMNRNMPPLVCFSRRRATIEIGFRIVYPNSIGGEDRGQARFFSLDERDKAIDWLLA